MLLWLLFLLFYGYVTTFFLLVAVITAVLDALAVTAEVPISPCVLPTDTIPFALVTNDAAAS